MDVSVVIPAFNERRRIRPALEGLAEYFDGRGASYELLVVDDGSTDDTAGAAREWARDKNPGPPLRVISIPHRGKGGAVAEGVMAAEGKWILMTDVDLSTPIREWERLCRELEEGADLAIGSRQAEGARLTRRQAWVRQHLGTMFGALVRKAFPVGVLDTQCGFKAFTAEAARELFRELRAKGLCFDVEIILRARSLGMKVAEVPVEWKNDPDSRVRVWKDLPGVLWDLWKIRRGLGSLNSGKERGPAG